MLKRHTCVYNECKKWVKNSERWALIVFSLPRYILGQPHVGRNSNSKSVTKRIRILPKRHNDNQKNTKISLPLTFLLFFSSFGYWLELNFLFESQAMPVRLFSAPFFRKNRYLALIYWYVSRFKMTLFTFRNTISLENGERNCKK